MEEVAGTAKLVDAAAVGAGSALTATLPRSDIEAALQDDAGADLFLEIARIQNGERNDRRDQGRVVARGPGEAPAGRERRHGVLHVRRRRARADAQRSRLRGARLEGEGGDRHRRSHGGVRDRRRGGACARRRSDGGSTPAPAAVAGMVTDNTSGGVPGAVTGFVTDASSAGVAAPADTGTNFVTDTTSGGQPGAVTGFCDGRIDKRPNGRDLRPRHRHRRGGHAQSRRSRAAAGDLRA